MPEQDIERIRAVHVVAESGKASEFLQKLYLPDIRGSAGHESRADDVQQGGRRNTDRRNTANRGQREASQRLSAGGQRAGHNEEDEQP